ncbi:hypothetical protein PVK06_016656 [Gossypium arboreum]|uniref:CCHC-type domain-containing protein n=1 Tax=Gossypium arboreum TaxID=29729 RepID=A0ABR0Q1Q4_GOSAR|nr:hypothetical protein PVK06_016656 [Gossypium arboreum]
MESDFARLTLNEEEETILQIPSFPITEREEQEFHLVGCFLTSSVIHFPVRMSTMANLWHPIRGVRILDLGEKRFLFQFFHSIDMERVLKGSPWTFNNHLLLLHALKWGEDPLKVPLVLSPFWVQIHDVPVGFFYEALAKKLSDFIGTFMEYDGANMGKGYQNFLRVKIQLDVRYPLKRKKQILFYGKRSYVKFKNERLMLFCFYCGRLGHSDSFCEARMIFGAETTEMGWDLSIRVQTRRA